MIARCVWTLLMLLLAGSAFADRALGLWYVLNPYGLLFLAGAAIVWCKWPAIIAAFRVAHDPSRPTILRFGYDALQGSGFKTTPDSAPGGPPPGA